MDSVVTNLNDAFPLYFFGFNATLGFAVTLTQH